MLVLHELAMTIAEFKNHIGLRHQNCSKWQRSERGKQYSARLVAASEVCANPVHVSLPSNHGWPTELIVVVYRLKEETEKSKRGADVHFLEAGV